MLVGGISKGRTRAHQKKLLSRRRFAPWAMSNGYSAPYTPVTQVYGHSHKSQFIVLTCCTAAQTISVLNVALSSLCTTTIECFLGCLRQLRPWFPPGGGGRGLQGGGYFKRGGGVGTSTLKKKKKRKLCKEHIEHPPHARGGYMTSAPNGHPISHLPPAKGPHNIPPPPWRPT